MSTAVATSDITSAPTVPAQMSGTPPQSIGDIVASAVAQIEAGTYPSPVAYSFEIFPPKTDAGHSKLCAALKALRRSCPLFVDVTFSAGGAAGAREATLNLCTFVQSIGVPAVMHVTGRGEDTEDTNAAIEAALAVGLRNFMALRGDALSLENGRDLAHGSDVVRLLRCRPAGAAIGVAVAGYPETHPESEGINDDIAHLCEKVDAGADIVVSQFFCDAEAFVSWKAECRARGITCPIVPGIMLVAGLAGFERMLKLCGRVSVPATVRAELDALKAANADAAAVQAFGVRLATRLCQDLYAAGERVFHFYTLNNEKSVLQLLRGLDWLPPKSPSLGPCDPEGPSVF